MESIEKSLRDSDVVHQENPKFRLPCRVFGLLPLIASVVYQNVNPNTNAFEDILCGYLFLDGLTDVVSGRHHYFSLLSIKFLKDAYQYNK